MSENNPKLTQFRNLAEKSISPTFLEAKQVEVTFFQKGNLFEQYVKVEYNAIQNATLSHKVGFSLEDFKKYCKIIVVSRIKYVLNEKARIKPTDHIAVPSFLENVIMQIGLAQDLKLGITISPAKYEDALPELSDDSIRTISMRLEAMKGYACGFGYPRDKSGSWEFMTMHCSDDQVSRFNGDAHPVYAMLAAVVGPAQPENSVLKPLVLYGDKPILEAMLWQLTSI